MNTNKFSARQVTLMGFFMATQLILTRMLAFETQYLRVSFSFIATTLMALFFGPFLTGIGTTLSDFVGIFLFPKTAPYFPGFSLSAFLRGWLYGIFLYQKKSTWQRILTVNLIIIIFVDIVLNTLWLYLMMGTIALASLPIRIFKGFIFLPVQVGLTYFLTKQKVIKNQIERN